ncbi:hypothetical protein SVAN01_00489 [Stagonosporopsis vannaccii]|nr:hypothetical protein SVAN01_00489 [Stagonosporopsis vannaccii]
MADAHFTSQQQSIPSQSTQPASTFSPSSKRRKIIGQCPTCTQSFASRHELRAHISDPSHHAPGSDSDAVSFGELSSEYDSADEPMGSDKHKGSTSHEDEPTLENDGFEFSPEIPHQDPGDDFGFDFDTAETGFSSKPAPDQGSVHSLPADDTAPSADCTPIETPPARPKTIRGGALGVLYCGTCDKLFGNEKVFKRHFMFKPQHGAEERDVRELYYRVWGQSWGEEARRKGEMERGEEMEM